MFTRSTTSANKDYVNWHGFQGNPKWKSPTCVAKSDVANRADQNNLIRANEYIDTEEVLESKIDAIVKLIKSSENCITYTGAGLSKASGIPDYATKSKESVVSDTPRIKSNLDAQPTYAHYCLVALENAGYLKHWVQQNHDGLPQKAGFPQEKINEIHGAWFDPSNPVVQFSEELRTDLFKWMANWERRADLCLCLGTSLSGMNADRMASTPARKAKEGKNSLGTIIINLQQTPMDADCTIRVWAKLDDALRILMNKLQLEVESEPYCCDIPEGDVFQIPYDASGRRSSQSVMTLDLRKDAKIKVVQEGASNENAEGKITGKRDDGSYRVELAERKKGGSVKVVRLLGPWFIESAIKGELDSFPIVNLKPQVDTLMT